MSSGLPSPSPRRRLKVSLMAFSSIVESFLDKVQHRGNETAALVKRDGKYRSVTWNDMQVDVEKIASSLIHLGLKPGEQACIIANTSIHWVTIDLGILSAGGVTVPIYPSNLPDECHYVIEHSDAQFVFSENSELSNKILEVANRLPNLKKIIQLSGTVSGLSDKVINLEQFFASAATDKKTIESRIASLTPDSILTIIYTSGTTGRPKGVVLTHSNMLYEGEALQSIDMIRPPDVQLFFLPLAHVFAKVLETMWLTVGHVMAFAENMTTIKDNLAEVRPTMMVGVPRVFERFHAAVVQKGTSSGGLKQALFERALELSEKNGKAELEEKRLGLADSIQFSFLKKIIFAKIGEGIMNVLGGRMRLMISGGAPLSPKIAWFFRDAGISIVEGYGLTETSAGTCVNLAHSNKIGTVGPPIPGTQIKIAEDGEILIKGGGVMREYWKNPEATNEVLKDGWLHTGDIGQLDPRFGTLKITDRKKDLIVTSGGKNVPPQKVENLLRSHKLIANVVVHGDKRKFLSALLTLDADQLNAEAKTMGLSGDYATLSQHPEIVRRVQQLVDESNQTLASFETIKKFKILDHDFSVESGELTPKMSVKRKVVSSKYGHIFDGFYEEKY